MDLQDKKLCMGCMSQKDYEGECRICGYSDDMPHSLDFLPPGTVLSDRYVVGRLLSSNGESGLYIGYDTQNDIAVWVKEYMPGAIATRNHSTHEVISKQGYEAQFKSLMSDFEDLCRSLQRLDSSFHVIPVLDIVHGNNTVYGIFRYIKTLTYGTFLHKSGGELTWGQAKKLFMPLFKTLSGLHDRGIIHRGISPNSILIDQKGNLWFSAFAIGAVRTDHSELEAELFSGYSAPEQYSISSWQGTWTDVYSIAAVLYRTLTGTMPPESITRKINDNLLPPNQLDSAIPQNISNAIFEAMTVSIDDRIQTIDQFTGALLETQESNTAVYVAKSEKNLETTQTVPYSDTKQKKEEKERSSRYVLAAMFITAFILVGILVFVLMKVVPDILYGDSSSVSGSNSGDTVSQSMDSGVIKFVGLLAKDVQANADYTSRYELHFKEVFNEDYPEGLICNQEPVEGTPMQNRGVVTLYVSKGSEYVKMPNLVGSTVEYAVQTLTDMGIQSKVVEKIDDSLEPGLVASTDKQPGDKLQKNKDTVIIITKSTSINTISKSSEPEFNEGGGWWD